jgi:hypothetical protein
LLKFKNHSANFAESSANFADDSAKFAYNPATHSVIAESLYNNGKVSSAAILSIRDNVKHTKWKVLVENLAKTPFGSLIFKG